MDYSKVAQEPSKKRPGRPRGGRPALSEQWTGRLCVVCSLPDRAAIEEAILFGQQTQVQIASDAGISLRTLQTHIHKHMAFEVTTCGVTTAEGQEARQGLLKALEALEQKTEKILTDAMRANKPETALKALDRRLAQLQFVAKLTGSFQQEAPNQELQQKRISQLERSIDLALAEAQSAGLSTTAKEIGQRLGAADPEIAQLLPMTKYFKKASTQELN